MTRQTLGVRLESARQAAGGGSKAVDVLQTTFTAQNSSSQSDTNRNTPVCAPTTNRTR